MKYKMFIVNVILVLGIGITGLQAQMLYVKENGGAQTTYALSNIRKLTFSSGNLMIHKTDNTNGIYALDELKYLSFKDYATWIEEPFQNNNVGLMIYPNPTSDILYIDLSGTDFPDGSISILSLDGNVLLVQKTNNAGIVNLSLITLPQGIYICRFTNDKEIRTVKITKQ